MRGWIPICGAVLFSLAMGSTARAQLQADYKLSSKRPNLRTRLTSRKVGIKQAGSSTRPGLGFMHLGITRYKPKVLKVTAGRGVLTTSLRNQRVLNVPKSSMQHASPKEDDE